MLAVPMGLRSNWQVDTWEMLPFQDNKHHHYTLFLLDHLDYVDDSCLGTPIAQIMERYYYHTSPKFL